MAVVATLSKSYDLDYMWSQVGPGPQKDGAGYYPQASQDGGEPPGRWWGPGAEALGSRGSAGSSLGTSGGTGAVGIRRGRSRDRCHGPADAPWMRCPARR
jgi:hypothetical protein